MLDEGITSQGAVSKSHDSMGKRMWVATPKVDATTQHKTIPAGRTAAGASGVDSSVQRSDNGTK